MNDETSQHVEKVEKCSVSVTPFSINDILSNKMESVDDECDLQEAALDMSKTQNLLEGNNCVNSLNKKKFISCYSRFYLLSLSFHLLARKLMYNILKSRLMRVFEMHFSEKSMLYECNLFLIILKVYS